MRKEPATPMPGHRAGIGDGSANSVLIPEQYGPIAEWINKHIRSPHGPGFGWPLYDYYVDDDWADTGLAEGTVINSYTGTKIYSTLTGAIADWTLQDAAKSIFVCPGHYNEAGTGIAVDGSATGNRHGLWIEGAGIGRTQVDCHGGTLFKITSSSDFDANEGFHLRNMTVYGAGGVIQLGTSNSGSVSRIYIDSVEQLVSSIAFFSCGGTNIDAGEIWITDLWQAAAGQVLFSSTAAGTTGLELEGVHIRDSRLQAPFLASGNGSIDLDSVSIEGCKINYPMTVNSAAHVQINDNAFFFGLVSPISAINFRSGAVLTHINISNNRFGTLSGGAAETSMITITAPTSCRNLIVEGNNIWYISDATNKTHLVWSTGTDPTKQTEWVIIGNGLSPNSTLTPTIPANFSFAKGLVDQSVFGPNAPGTCAYEITGDNNFFFPVGSGGEAGQYTVKVTANDTTPNFLLAKLAAGTGITLTETNDAGDEDVTVGLDDHDHTGDAGDGGTITEASISDLDHAGPIAAFFTETDGPTALTLGAIIDGAYLKRSGATVVGDTPAGGGAEAMDDLTDADTTTDPPAKNEVLKWNGTNWVPAVYNASFTFSIASFTDNITPNLLIGSGVWKTDEAMTFGATYNNGPPTTIVVEMTVNGAAYAKVGEMTAPAYTAGKNTEGNINYPSKGQYLRFRLDGDDGTDHDTEYDTAIYFYNYLYFGVIAKADTFTEADIEGLTGHVDFCTSGNLSHSVAPDAGEYIVLAYPTDYTAMSPGVDYDATGASSFLLNGVTVGMVRDNAALSITNSAGFTENYDVYVSALAALGGPFTFVAGTTPNTCNYVYWGEIAKASGLTEADVEGNYASQPGQVATNSISARSMVVNAAVDEYTYIAYPTRLGTMTSCVIGGFESKGDFNVDTTTLAITNENGWTEHYTVYVSDNPGFTDPTTMTVTVA